MPVTPKRSREIKRLPNFPAQGSEVFSLIMLMRRMDLAALPDTARDRALAALLLRAAACLLALPCAALLFPRGQL